MFRQTRLIALLAAMFVATVLGVSADERYDEISNGPVFAATSEVLGLGFTSASDYSTESANVNLGMLGAVGGERWLGYLWPDATVNYTLVSPGDGHAEANTTISTRLRAGALYRAYRSPLRLGVDITLLGAETWSIEGETDSRTYHIGEVPGFGLLVAGEFPIASGSLLTNRPTALILGARVGMNIDLEFDVTSYGAGMVVGVTL